MEKLLSKEGLRKQRFRERNKIHKELSELFVLMNREELQATSNELGAELFVELAMYIALNGGRSNDPETWKKFEEYMNTKDDRLQTFQQLQFILRT